MKESTEFLRFRDFIYVLYGLRPENFILRFWKKGTIHYYPVRARSSIREVVQQLTFCLRHDDAL